MKKTATIKDWQIERCDNLECHNDAGVPLIERAKLSLIGKCLYESGEYYGEIIDITTNDVHNYVVYYKFGLTEFNTSFDEDDFNDLVTDGELGQYFDQYDDDGNVVDTTVMRYEIRER